jgi:hypothetical protein
MFDSEIKKRGHAKFMRSQLDVAPGAASVVPTDANPKLHGLKPQPPTKRKQQ